MNKTRLINVTHISYSCLQGGASRAALRLHNGLRNHSGKRITSSLRTIVDRTSLSHHKYGAPEGKSLLFIRFIHSFLQLATKLILRTRNKMLHSPPVINTGLGLEITNKFKNNMIDIAHLHNLYDCTLSIKEIGNLPVPIVWTLHDQWAFCGAEHYVLPPDKTGRCLDYRYQQGYNTTNRNISEKGFDINRYVFNLKLTNWDPASFFIVSSSKWMFECAKQSYLFSKSHHFLVPIPIDTDFWLPIPQDHARSILSLPKDKICILFGAAGGLKDYRKGGDLFLNILNSIKSICTQYGFEVSDFLVVTFGRDSQISEDMTDFENVSLGQINSDETMRYLYSSCDLMVLPSRQDTLTCIGMEAQSCGLPVFCFDSCGVTDIVEDNLTGFISPSFDCYHLAGRILAYLSNECSISIIRNAARARAVTKWSPDVVAKQYQSIYELASKLTSL